MNKSLKDDFKQYWFPINGDKRFENMGVL